MPKNPVPRLVDRDIFDIHFAMLQQISVLSRLNLVGPKGLGKRSWEKNYFTFRLKKGGTYPNFITKYSSVRNYILGV